MITGATGGVGRAIVDDVAFNFLNGFGLTALLADHLAEGSRRIVNVVPDSMNGALMINSAATPSRAVPLEPPR